MEIIFVTRSRRNRRRIHLGNVTSRLAGLAVVALVVGAFVLGHRWSERTADVRPDLYAAAWQQEMARQRRAVDGAIGKARLDMDALASQLGEMRSRVVRLDALGGRLVEMAELDRDEFAFDRPPALGGVPATVSEPYSVPDFLAELRNLSHQLDDRSPKLEAIETAMMSTRLLDEILPSGRPVLKGWISSAFGHRADPVTGRKNFHEGVDFPGKKGSPILAAASGVVRWSGRRSGYGQLVELSHGNGYVTRYAHNSKNLVKVGTKVEKGQTIALMGATGYVTGVHVHFEVLKDGKPIDPLDFVDGEKK